MAEPSFALGNLLGSPFRVLGQIVRNRIPRRTAFDKSVKLRPDPGIIVKRPHDKKRLHSTQGIAPERHCGCLLAREASNYAL